MSGLSVTALEVAYNRQGYDVVRDQDTQLKDPADRTLKFRLAAVLLFVVLGSVVTFIMLGRFHSKSVDQVSDVLFEQQAKNLMSDFRGAVQHQANIASTAALMLPANLSRTTAHDWQKIVRLLRSGPQAGDFLQLELFVAYSNIPASAGTGRPLEAAEGRTISTGNDRLSSETIAPFGIRAFKLESHLFAALNDDTGDEQVVPVNRIENYAAAVAAQESGAVSMSVSEGRSETGYPLIDLYIPLFRLDSTWTPQDRVKHFSGVLIARQDVEAVLEPLRRNSPVELLRVSSNEHTFYEAIQFPPLAADEIDETPRQLSMNILNQNWVFDFRKQAIAGHSIQSRLINPAPLTGLIASLVIAGVGILVFRVCSSQSRRQGVDQAALLRELALTRRMNADLESFAYIVAHDLKTPLQGATTLCDLLLDDIRDWEKNLLKPHATGSTSSKSLIVPTKSEYLLAEYTFRISQQLDKMDELIDGIHQFSSIGHGSELIEQVDTRKSVMEVAVSLSVADHRLKIGDNLPIIQTYRTRFEQTLANLIGNAFKYHHDPDNANVLVSASSYGNFYSFAVADDGPGINPENHNRIFEVFESIRDDQTEGSGVGLSIVKKAIESVGGVVSVESSIGNGTTFRFLWPKNIIA